MHISTMQAHIGKWHYKTFGAVAPVIILEKITEECKELNDAHDGDSPNLPDELADVVIATMAYCARKNINLESAMKKKLAALKLREYKHVNGTWKRIDK